VVHPANPLVFPGVRTRLTATVVRTRTTSTRTDIVNRQITRIQPANPQRIHGMDH
jgi:hypothetical protein